VTGASGFVGRHVVYSLLSRRQFHDEKGENKKSNRKDHDREIILCLVRPNRIAAEEEYWNSHLRDYDIVTQNEAGNGSDEDKNSRDENDDHIDQQNNQANRKMVSIKVLPYDMVDGGQSLHQAMRYGFQQHLRQQTTSSCDVCIYHIASVFGPTPNPVQTARENVQSATDAVKAMESFHSEVYSEDSRERARLRLVLTSSMAAVRATNQTPLNGKYYTYRDWNTLSKLDVENWGSCYQWSKAESEKKAWEMIQSCNNRWKKEQQQSNINAETMLEMVALCPSFVFGPPPPLPSSLKNDKIRIRENNSSSYSLTLVNQWLRGNSQVQSRLCADVRDVALAHVAAGTMDLTTVATTDDGDFDPMERRYILSTEKRLSSELVSDALKRAVTRVQGQIGIEGRVLGDASIDMGKITCDTKFDGGAIKIGEREVEATERLEQDLGVVCRSVEETFQDMAEALLMGESF